MARDRSPLSQRLKSLAQRAGRPDEETGSAPAPDPAAAGAPAPAPSQDDEQPTGEVPAVAEQPTDEQPALTLPPEPPTAPSAPVPPQPVPDAPTAIHEIVTPDPPSGPTLSPPVLQPREVPAEPTPNAEPTPDPEPTPEQPESDADEPFSGATIWPQSSPTPRFEPQPDAEADAPAEAEAPTFPEPSPEPADVDESAAGFDDSPTVNAAAIEIPAELTAEPDPTAGAGANAAPAKPTRSGGLLGRLRPTRDRTTDAEPAPEPVVATLPTTPLVEEDPRPAILPPSPEPPAKPSFSERASLRRRAKSLRARRDAGLLELGAIVLDQRRFGDPTGGSLMRKRTDELADIDSELAAIEQVLDDDGPAETVAQLGVVRCLTCTSLLGPTDRFCVQCGAPRPEDAAPRTSS